MTIVPVRSLSVSGVIMRIFMCLCVFASVTNAGFIGYPFSYSTVVPHPVTTYAIAKPLGTFHGLHGYPLALGPSYFSYNVLPGNFLYSNFPGVVTYFPAVEGDKKKKDKKKPGDKKDEKKEETTEEPKQEEENAGEEEDLNE